MTEIQIVDRARLNRQRARKCRELAKLISKPTARTLLEELAGELEAKAVAVERTVPLVTAASH